jgi:hypothetical protein
MQLLHHGFRQRHHPTANFVYFFTRCRRYLPRLRLFLLLLATSDAKGLLNSLSKFEAHFDPPRPIIQGLIKSFPELSSHFVSN